jgi:hypothetical protein
MGDWARSLGERLIKNDPPEHKLELAENLLAQEIRLVGPDGGPTSRARADVAKQLERMGRLTEARLLRQEVLDANRHHLGDEHPYTLGAEMWLGANLRDSQLLEEARPLFAHVCHVRRHTLGPNDERTLEAESYLASLDDWGNHD